MTDSSPDTQENERIDRFGAVASSLCAIHCAICALLPAAFGALGLGMLLSQEVEWLFTIFAVLFALVALILVVRQNRSYAIAGLLSLGIIGLLASRGLEMGSGHHHGDDHHGEEHHAEHSDKHEVGHHADHKEGNEEEHHAAHKEEHHDEHKQDAHEDKHHDEDEEAEHSDSMHSVGASLGVLGGLLLLFGHILNIRSMRSNPKKDNS